MFQCNLVFNVFSFTTKKSLITSSRIPTKNVIRSCCFWSRILYRQLTSPQYNRYGGSSHKTIKLVKRLLHTTPIYNEYNKSHYGSKKCEYYVSGKHNVNSQFFRYFQTSDRRESSGLLIKLLKPVTRVLAILFGLTFRRWWLSLTAKQRAVFIRTLKQNTAFIFFILSFLYGCMCLFYVTHLYTCPVTKRKKFIMFSYDQIKNITDLEQSYIIEKSKESMILSHHPLYKKIAKVVQNIIQSNQDIANVRNKTWTLFVIDGPNVKNAFALSNGSIFIFTGLLTLAENENQLGIILSHEMAHAVLSHREEQISNGNFLQFLLFIPIVLLWASLPIGWALLSNWIADYFTSLLIQLPFSRSLEAEADKVGLFIAAKACIDVREAALFWNKLQIMASASVVPYEPIEFFSTHPNYETRKKLIQQNMREALNIRSRSNCPPLIGEDTH